MNDKPLERSAILHAVFQEFREAIFDKAFPGLDDFGSYLGELAKNSRGLSKSAISRWLTDASPPPTSRITIHLNDESTAKAVATKCGLSLELFSAPSLLAAVKIAAPSENTPPPSDEACWVVDGRQDNVSSSDLCSTEQQIVTKLSGEMRRAKKHLLVTMAPFDAGMSFLWHQTASSQLVPEYADAIYFLRPNTDPEADVIHDFGPAISWLAAKLGLPPAPSPRTIVNKLIELRSTAIFLAVSGPLDERLELMAETALRHHRKADQPIAIVISSALRHPRVDSKLAHADECTIDERQMEMNFEERYPFFKIQWQRYCTLRNAYRPDDGGSRLKRARWYYKFLRGRSIYPINIRLRAFFASNLSNFSYFDPTSGFDKLCNMPKSQLPLEISMFRDDVAKHVSLWDTGRREPPLRPLKWCSTAIYWLTEDTALDLAANYTFPPLQNFEKRDVVFKPDVPRSVQNVPRVRIESFKEAANDLPAIISYREKREDGSDQFRYVAGTGTKAIVQDFWARTEPASRAYAHYRIAHRLYKKRQARGTLSEEFPFAPHWGRSGIFFLSECIRHLMRTLPPIVSLKPPPGLSKIGKEFPAAPTRSLQGCDPFEVLSFCFGRVYWQEMDGNAPGEPGRMLSQRHGLYHLSAELLQLISKDEVLGEPHWALDQKLHGKYYASAAIAQLELGNLKSALALFDKRYAYVQKAQPGSLDELTAALDVVGVKIELHQLKTLFADIENIEALLRAYQEEGKGTAEQVKQIGLHCTILKGQLCYATGDFDRAEVLLDFNEDENKVIDDKLAIETSHYLVATLGAKSERLDETSGSGGEQQDELRDKALQIASRRLWHYASRGEQHVALGFRISIAHLFRNMGKAKIAETWMNSVYRDILRYGCSERTYLSFLREAGRIVRIDRPARAFAVYLRPAAIRAAARGHVRAALVAYKEAKEALADVEASITDLGDEWPKRLALELRELEELTDEADTEVHEYVPADPLFSFDIHWGSGWETKLRDAKAVVAERDVFTAEFEQLAKEGTLNDGSRP